MFQTVGKRQDFDPVLVLVSRIYRKCNGLDIALVEFGFELCGEAQLGGRVDASIDEILFHHRQAKPTGIGKPVKQNQRHHQRKLVAPEKAWDIDRLVERVEVTVGADLQYIRFNGAMIGGLAGLALHALEQGLKLYL